MKAVIIAIMTLGLISTAACASDDVSQKETAKLIEQGKIQKLESLLEIQSLSGELLDSELERKDGALVYELKWLDEQGSRHETYIDASSGELIKDKIDD